MDEDMLYQTSLALEPRKRASSKLKQPMETEIWLSWGKYSSERSSCWLGWKQAYKTCYLKAETFCCERLF